MNSRMQVLVMVMNLGTFFYFASTWGQKEAPVPLFQKFFRIYLWVLTGLNFWLVLKRAL